MPLNRVANAEPIPGYRLLEPLGSGGFGDVWKCVAPGGLFKAIKFVNGNLNTLDNNSLLAEQEFNALQRVKEIRHPFILSIERIEQIEGELLIVMELADKNLYDRFLECRSAGLPGIPRMELLRYLVEAAEALDLMNRHHDLQHLDIKPRNLFLVSHHVKVADFGLVKDLEGRTAGTPSAGPMGGVTPLYASPETFNGIISRHSDQYSLAIVYQELLTGTLPFTGKTPRQLFLQHTKEEPDLKPLPEADRPTVARALAKNQQHRYASCTDFVQALVTGQSTPPATARPPSSGSMALGRPSGMQATLEDLFLSPMDPGQVLDGYTDQSPEALSPEDLSRLSVTVAQPLSGAIRPTLILGLGGFGRQAMQALRCRIVDRFGSLAKLPLFRYLAIDSNLEALQRGLSGPPEQSLSSTEIHHLPLREVAFYRRSRMDFQQMREWLSEQKLYSIPRSLETDGTRGLGRLAFATNFTRLAARLRNELKLACDLQHIDQSVSQSGLPLRSETPQVYILTSASGGTGSGMLVDLGYALRKILQELGHSHAEVIAWLLGGAPSDPATPKEEQANLYATLTEINHFSDPAVEYFAQFGGNATPIRDQGPPFHAAYVVKMGHRNPEGLKDTAARMAGYLFHDLTTPLGNRLAQSRLMQRAAQETPFRSFGTYTIWFPRGLLLRVAARSACNRLLESWQTTSEDPDWMIDVANACDRRFADPRWRPENLMRRIEEAATTGIEGPPSQALTAFFAGLEAQSGMAVASEDPAGWCRQAVEKTHEWVGSGVSVLEETSEWRKSRIHRIFSAAVEVIADEYLDYLALPAREMFDQPGFRLAAAEAAYEHLIRRCEERLAAHQEVIDEQRRLTDHCSHQVEQAMDACLKSGTSFLFGSSRLRKFLRVFVERLAAYARQRLAHEVYRSVQLFYKALEGRLQDLIHDLQFCRQRLRHLQESLQDEPAEEDAYDNLENLQQEAGPMTLAQNYSSAVLREATMGLASRIVLPEGATDLDLAALHFLDRVPAELWADLDLHLQDQVLNRLGGLRQLCMTRNDLPQALGEPLLEGAAEFLSHHLPVTDVCEAEFSAAESLEIDLAAQMKAYYRLATPSVAARRPEREFGFMLLPNSEAGKRLASVACEALPKIQVVHVPSLTDFLFCREQADIGQEEIRDLLEPCRAAYEISTTSPKENPHARSDIIDWIPLDLGAR